MEYVVEQIFLIILVFFTICKNGIDKGIIISLLIGICCASVSIICSEVYVGFIIAAVLLGIGMVIPSGLVFITLAVYYLVYGRAYIGAVVTTVLALAISMNQDIYYIFFIIIVSVIAAYMAEKCRKLNELSINLKTLRDDSEENQMLLKERNKRLIDHQDHEVYVATLKERNRIAREIHDNVGHMLTRSILQLGALMTIHKNEEVGDQLSAVRENLDEAMNNIRQSVHDLHDESISLKQSIYELVQPLEEKYIVRFEYDIQEDMSREKKYAVIGIVKEAVSNIIKHSNKSMVDIILREHPAMYQIVLWDYDREDVHSKMNEKKAITTNSGIGMQNMADRVEALKGNIVITTGCGFKVFVTIPKDKNQTI